MTNESNDHKMTFLEHLEELRKRLLISIIAIVIGASIVYFFSPEILSLLKKPAGPSLGKLKVLSLTEGFMSYFKIAIIGGIILSIPVIFYQVWAFISPALKPNERRHANLFILWTTISFLIGCAFAYFVILPFAIPYLLNFGSGELEPMITVSKYLSFTSMMILGCGAIFELPILIYLLTKLGIVTTDFLTRNRKYAVLVCFIAAAIITPTGDVVNLLLLAVPMIGLYEIGILSSRLVKRKERQIP